MKLIKNASGKSIVKLSKVEWESIGLKAGWIRNAVRKDVPNNYNNINKTISSLRKVRDMLQSSANIFDANKANKGVGYYEAGFTQDNGIIDQICDEFSNIQTFGVLSLRDIRMYRQWVLKIEMVLDPHREVGYSRELHRESQGDHSRSIISAIISSLNNTMENFGKIVGRK